MPMPNILTDADKAKLLELLDEIADMEVCAPEGGHEEVQQCNRLGREALSILRALPAQVEQEPVWCGCGDGIMPDTGAKCGTCVHVASLASPTPAAPEAPQPVKCDGNHGGPRCADPECWNDEAAPAASAGMAVPDGWKLVPVEPTEEMRRAAMAAWLTRKPFPDVYSALLAASPSAQAAPARGAMTEDEINDLARRGGFISQPAKLSRTVHLMIRAILAAHGIGTTAPARGAMTKEQIDSMATPIFGFGALDKENMALVSEVVRAVERFHGIGTTAPAGGEG